MSLCIQISFIFLFLHKNTDCKGGGGVVWQQKLCSMFYVNKQDSLTVMLSILMQS